MAVDRVRRSVAALALAGLGQKVMSAKQEREEQARDHELVSGLGEGSPIAARPPLSVRAVPASKCSPWLTLRVTLLMLVLGLLLATIAALATINYASQTRSLEDLEGRYFALASETVAGQLQAALQLAAPSLNEAVYSASMLGTLAVDDDEALIDFLLTRMRFADGLTFFYYGAAATGRFVGVDGKPMARWSCRAPHLRSMGAGGARRE